MCDTIKKSVKKERRQIVQAEKYEWRPVEEADGIVMKRKGREEERDGNGDRKRRSR